MTHTPPKSIQNPPNERSVLLQISLKLIAMVLLLVTPLLHADTQDKSILRYAQLTKGNDKLPAITMSVTGSWVLITSPDIPKKYFLFFDRKQGHLYSFDTEKKRYTVLASLAAEPSNKIYTHVITAPLGTSQKLNDKYECDWMQITANNDLYQICSLKLYSAGINRNQLVSLEQLSRLLDQRRAIDDADNAQWRAANESILHQLRLMRVDQMKSLPLIIQQKDLRNYLVLNRIEYKKSQFDAADVLKGFTQVPTPKEKSGKASKQTKEKPAA